MELFSFTQLDKPGVVRRVSLGAGYLGYLGIVILSLLPGSSRPHTGWGGQMEHVIAYALVGGAFGLGYPFPRSRIVVGVLLTATAAALEGLQYLIPGRTPELISFAAGLFGAWIGVGLAIATLKISGLRYI